MTVRDPLLAPPSHRPTLTSMALALAAMAALVLGIIVPVTLNEIKKHYDRTTKADLLEIALVIKANIATDGELPAITMNGRDVFVDSALARTLADGVELGSLRGDATEWCIDAHHSQGDHAKLDGYRYDLAKDEIVVGSCPTDEDA